MLGVLFAKDCRRTWRNPWPWVLNLSLPIVITAIFGFVFGGGNKGPQVAKIKVAVVDEDESVLGSFFKSAFSQGDAAKHFEVTHATREQALGALRENRLSAILIVPAKFSEDFLSGNETVALEVIKNPAERIYPAIVEELAGVVVTGLNAVHRNLNSEFPKLRAALTNKFDLLELGSVITDLGNRVKHAKEYLAPPLVQYRKAVIEKEKKEKSGPGFSIFGFILPGMASAFLLFIADHSMRDVHREARLRTLDRLRSIQTSVTPFVASKILFTTFSVVAGSVILFGGGGLIFQIPWGSPGLLALACLGYAIFAGGLMAMLAALITNERKAETINNMIFFGIAFAGGSYFPAEQMPAFMREHICPWMPNYWFIETVRGLQRGEGIHAFRVVLALAGAGAILALGASVMMNRRLTGGARR